MALKSEVLLVALAATFALMLAGQASSNQQEELENLRLRIAEMQSEIAKTSESKSEAADALRASEMAISNSNRKIAELATQQREADLKLNALQGKQNNVAESGASYESSRN